MTRPTCGAERNGERLHRVGAAALAAAVALSAGCRTTADMQRDYAKTLRPADLEAAPTEPAKPSAAVRTFRVRLYADAGYQRQTLRWREKLVAQLERANRVLEPLLGVRLAAESVRTWESGGLGEPRDGARLTRGGRSGATTSTGYSGSSPRAIARARRARGSLRGAVRDGAPEADAVDPHLSWSPVAVENEEQPFAPPH
jgi:hypothetical protein